MDEHSSPLKFPTQDESKITFFKEAVELELPPDEDLIHWIERTIEKAKAQLETLNYIFCSDNYLHQLNVDYLSHDTLTDIITFPYSVPPKVHGDIFISVERIQENATIFKTSFEQELLRVIIHGVLHLCGFKDKSEQEAVEMRRKEDEALSDWIALKK